MKRPDANQCSTSNTALCLARQWSPGRAVDWTLSPCLSMTTHPCIGSPILPLQGGDSRHSLEAAASENSALASLVPCTGKHRSPAELTLSCCFHAQAALALFGLTLLPILCWGLLQSAALWLQLLCFWYLHSQSHFPDLEATWRAPLATPPPSSWCSTAHQWRSCPTPFASLSPPCIQSSAPFSTCLSHWPPPPSNPLHPKLLQASKSQSAISNSRYRKEKTEA